jgi:hypothetical protein
MAARRQDRNLRDTHILILGPSWRRACRAITTWLATVILLVPVIILDNISSFGGRIVTIVLSAGLFLSTVSHLTKRGLWIYLSREQAVLVVFTSASNNGTSNKGCSVNG